MHLALGNQWALIGMPMAQVKTIKREEKCLTTSTLLLTQWRRERGRGEGKRCVDEITAGNREARRRRELGVDGGKWARERDTEPTEGVRMKKNRGGK